MRKLTDDELREPNVDLYIPYNTNLPDIVINELTYFGGVAMMSKEGKMFTKYTVPAYRAREWEQLTQEYLESGE